MEISKLAIALIIFGLAYLYFAISPRNKWIGLWGGVVLLLLFRIIKISGLIYLVNWNIIGIFVGTLIIAELFIESGIPAVISEIVASKSANIGIAIILLSIISGIISSFCENVTTLLILAPVAFHLAKRLHTSPVPFIISISLSSNLQGTATLIGDPPSMILASYTKMTFNNFFFIQNKMSIFFAVEIGALASIVVMYLMFRRLKKPVSNIEKEKVKTYSPLIFFILLILYLVFISRNHIYFQRFAGLGAVIIGAISMIFQHQDSPLVIKRFDWETLLSLIAIFTIVGALTEVGAATFIAEKIGGFTRENIFWTFSILIWSSVVASAFIDNIPFVTAMIPIGMSLAASHNIPPYLYTFGIVIGATVGGNITPIGAASNLVSFGLLRKKGYKVSFRDFVKIGLPFTIFAVLASYIFLWYVWK